MSTRIIIEKDGERYAPVDLFEHWFADDMSSIGMSNDDGEIEFAIKQLPPVIRTDNSEVIANLEAENAKLRKQYDNEHLSKLKVVQHEGELITANYELREENAKLREALKPIMECDVDNINLHGHMYPVSVIERISKSVGAVRKAQAIMKGGAE